MQKRKYVLLSAAAAVGMPVISHAATIAYSFDLADLTVSTTAAGTYTAASSTPGVTVVPGANGSLTVNVPIGEYVQYGLDATVTNNSGFGIASFQTGVSSSSAAVATVNPNATVVNPFFSSLSSVGTVDGLGGVDPQLGTSGSYIAGGTLSAAKTTYGAGSPAELYNTQRVKPLATSSASVTLTVNQNVGALGFIVAGAPTSSGAKTYVNRAYDPALDTIATLPKLTINYGAVTSSTTSSTVVPNKIIALTTTAPTTYGSQLNGHAISITSSGSGSYTVGNTGQVADPGATTAYTAVSTFISADQEVYALKLDYNGSSIATNNTTLIAAIIADITGSETNVTASTVSGVYASLFPTYDILLTSTAGFTTPTGTSYLGVDFSGDTLHPGVTVTEIAAVPEPASASLLVLGASGLLLKRRKSRELVA